MTLLPLIAAATGTHGVGGSAFGAAAWPSSNRIFYVPVRLQEAFTVKRVFWTNGGTVSGSVNLGLYDVSGSKLWETGSTAQTGTNQTQFVNIADQAHARGVYYIAIQHSNTTGQYGRTNPGIYVLALQGMLQESPGSFALPATATFAAIATDFLPMCGLDLRG